MDRKKIRMQAELLIQSAPSFRLRSRSFCCLLILVTVGCHYGDYSNQLQSANDMLALGRMVHEKWMKQGPLSSEEVQELARSEGLDRDRWGNELSVYVAADSWVIAYPGRDGKLDVVDLKAYLGKKPVDVKGLYDHDIVFDSENFLLTIAVKILSEDAYPRGPLVPEG